MTSSSELLEAAYEHLEYDQGALYSSSGRPTAGAETEWIEKGDWLALAQLVGAEKIFFVDEQPVVVFAKLSGSDPNAFRLLYNRIWSMARPRLLFLAQPGELTLYDLGQPPIREGESLEGQSRLVERAKTVADVQSKLKAFHRELIESGEVFAEKRFGDGLHRADRALIRDLKIVLHGLSNTKPVAGMKRPERKHLHALIGRSIFIRYLEDRSVLGTDYFKKIAARRSKWQELLEKPLGRPINEPEFKECLFFRVLKDKQFTYALFDQLADDFNGDVFPVEDEERERIHDRHMEMLQGFLLGEPTSQGNLFFYAYRFDVIPIELISSIYEEFYNERQGKERNQGSHYTPPALVEFVLSQTLTPELLATNPRVADPSCGSGIFLVESFRRMVRYQWARQDKRPSRAQLLKTLRDQIAGIDVNEEAVRVAAFSLYLAFLHYQEPREINEEKQLPFLKWVAEDERKNRLNKKPADFLDILLAANSFDIVLGKADKKMIDQFGPLSADVVVGNPPWGYPKPKDQQGHATLQSVLEWCSPKYGRPIGDKELSQAFIHLTLALLRDGGRAGMLVSSGVFFKHHKNSKDFRRVWLNSVLLRHVVNFAHVRHVFFSDPNRESKAVSPFASVVFEKCKPMKSADDRFEYWSAKRTATVEGLQAVLLTRGDMHWISQHDCLANEKLWKIFLWGGHRDEALIGRLDLLPKLGQLPRIIPNVAVVCKQGFTESDRDRKPSPRWFLKYQELPAERFTSYGPLNDDWFLPVPRRVKRTSIEAIYSGVRLLIGRGIGQGRITARLETKPFAFRNSINAVRLEGLTEWQEKTLLGIALSSLMKYYLFMTLGSWLWHDEIHKEHVVHLPVQFPRDPDLRRRIVGIVDRLRSIGPQTEGLFSAPSGTPTKLTELERQLDEAIFQLFELSESEMDLVRETCTLGLDLYYLKSESDSVKPVDLPDVKWGNLEHVAVADRGLASYIRTFLEFWNKELEAEGEFVWQVIIPPSAAPILAVRFETRYKDNVLLPPTVDDQVTWQQVLDRLSKASLLPTGSSRIFTDTFFRIANEREIILVKRNERRFWTRTAAREDAEAVLVHFLNTQEAKGTSAL